MRSPGTAARQEPPLAATRETPTQQQRPRAVRGKSQTRNYRFGGLTNKHLFLTDLEAAKSKIKVPATLMSGDGLLPPSHFALRVESAKEPSGVLL